MGRHRTSQGTGPPRKPAYCLLSKLLGESELVKRLFRNSLSRSFYGSIPCSGLLRGSVLFYMSLQLSAWFPDI